MKRYSYMNCRIGRPAFVVFLFVLLILARDTLITTVALGFTRSQLLMLGCICAVGLGFLFVHRKNWKAVLTDRRMLVMAVSTLLILLPMVAKRDWQMMYFSILLCLLFAVFLTYFRSLEEVAKIYVVILSVLGVYSLITTYFVKELAAAGILSVPQIVNSKNYPFYNFGLSYAVTWSAWKRNNGIFREPGVYQYFLILALYLHNYVCTWKKPWKYWTINACLAITMLSTFATGGVLELALLAVVVFFDKEMYRDKRIVAVVVVLLLLLAILVGIVIAQRGPLYWEIRGMVIEKFTPKEESFSERTEAVLADIGFFFHNPIFGEKLSTVLHSVANNTTSTLVMFAAFGIGGGLLQVEAWFALIWDNNRKRWVNVAMVPILFLSFNTQNLNTDVFFWLFPMMALTERLVPLLENRKKKV